ncbi:MAG TPA: hypothetical protein VLQ78_11920, partial [Ornithinibacter sp.]|nr:hypothetical protein [Ornithinibacter sp.]
MRRATALVRRAAALVPDQADAGDHEDETHDLKIDPGGVGPYGKGEDRADHRHGDAWCHVLHLRARPAVEAAPVTRPVLVDRTPGARRPSTVEAGRTLSA